MKVFNQNLSFLKICKLNIFEKTLTIRRFKNIIALENLCEMQEE